MRRAGHVKFSREQIEQALAKVQSGQSLTEIARDMNMSKAGLSYRLSRLSAEGRLAGSKDLKRWQGEFSQACWKNLSRVNHQLARKIDEASFSELVRLFESLSEVMLKLTPMVQLQIQGKVQPALDELGDTKRIFEEYLREERGKRHLDAPNLEQGKAEEGGDAQERPL